MFLLKSIPRHKRGYLTEKNIEKDKTNIRKTLTTFVDEIFAFARI